LVFELLATLLLAQAPAAPVKLASPGFTAIQMEEKLANFYADHFAQQLSLRKIRVLTASEISALIGFERQKELLGCNENSQSCVAELANALGVDGLIVGSLARLDGLYQVNLKIISSQDAQPLVVYAGKAEGDRALLGKLEEAARQAAEALARWRPGQVEASAPAVTTPVTRPSEAPWLITGGAVAGVGAGLVIWSFLEEGRIGQAEDYQQARRHAATAALTRGFGTLAALGGLTALTIGAVRQSRQGKVKVSGWVAPGAGGWVLQGELP
jgi:hypothetical protein